MPPLKLRRHAECQKEQYNVSYDANSNITALSRTMGDGQLLDQMTYRYATRVFDSKTMKPNNRLLHVNDAVSTPGISTDMEDQGAYNPNNAASWNYRYDAMGRIISNRHDGVAQIEYNAYNKCRVMYKMPYKLKLIILLS